MITENKNILKIKLDLIRLGFLSQFFNSFMINGVGDVMKVVSANEDYPDILNIGKKTIFDRLLDVVAIIIGGIIGLIYFRIFQNQYHKYIFLIILGSLALIGALYFVLNKCHNGKIIFIKSKISLLIPNGKLIGVLSIFLTISVWILEGIKVYFLLNIIQPSNLDLLSTILLVMLVWFGTLILIPISGSLGTKELIFNRTLILRGFESQFSGLISILDRLIVIIISGFILAILTIFLKITQSLKKM